MKGFKGGDDGRAGRRRGGEGGMEGGKISCASVPLVSV